MIMKQRKNKINWFDFGNKLITYFVGIFFLIVLGTILWKGLPYFMSSLKSEEVQFAIGLSIITASISTLICVLLAIPVAYSLTKTKFFGEKVLSMILELPLSLPYLVLGLSLLLIFASPLGKWLSSHGFTVIFSPVGIIFAHMVVNLPFVIRIIKTAFMEVDPRLEFIARTLGAKKSKAFFTVTLPLAKNTILGATILAWSRGLGEFGATLMLVGATRMKTETLPSSIYLNMATGDMGVAMASAMFLLLISIVSSLLFRCIQPKTKKSRVTIF